LRYKYMNNNELMDVQSQLLDRQRRLKNIINTRQEIPQLVGLLREVDAALERIDSGTYGICLTCRDPIEKDRLAADPLVKFCLDHLNMSQQKSLEADLELASHIQNTLLPKNNFVESGYEISYHYHPAGPVGGDYCDLVVSKNGTGNIYFILGDITGKGIAASMLVNHLYALFHSLIDLNLPLVELFNRVNRLFCESSLYTHFATMVCGKASADGEVEICNAGHCLPLLIREKEIISIDSTGLPLGLFHTFDYEARTFRLEEGESILIYTDGLSEARKGEEEFGVERINQIAKGLFDVPASESIKILLENLNCFTESSSANDDLTLMSIRRLS
jgi:phosphoserine phosphatase RsbU/P